jgi:hypothetical protein
MPGRPDHRTVLSTHPLASTILLLAFVSLLSPANAPATSLYLGIKTGLLATSPGDNSDNWAGGGVVGVELPGPIYALGGRLGLEFEALTTLTSKDWEGDQQALFLALRTGHGGIRQDVFFKVKLGFVRSVITLGSEPDVDGHAAVGIALGTGTPGGGGAFEIEFAGLIADEVVGTDELALFALNFLYSF